MKRVRRVAMLVIGPLALLVTAPLVAQGAEAFSTSTAAIVLPDAPQPQLTPARYGTPGDDAGFDGPGPQLSLRETPKRILSDELHIVTSPARIRARDLKWLLPLAAATGASLVTDTHVMRDVVSHDAGFNSANDTTSTVIRDVYIGVPIAMFAAGEALGNPRERETGMLAGEAMLEAYVTDAAIKYAFLRERPSQFDTRGHFLSTAAASDPSFVSGHSIVAWSSAAVLAGEYSKPWQQAGLYALASSVSVTRVLAQQHFPTDVLLGSVAGWLIGHYVYVRHHKPQRSGRG